MDRGRVQLSTDVSELHVAMLNDRARTSAYLAALRAAVGPGDVVLDVGTGTGVFAVAAALAGARHVFAIEGGPVRGVASRIFAANGVAQRITLIPRWSTSARLPEPADVLVAELIGDEPLAEGIVGIARDAVRRMLTPSARLIPGRVRVFAAPLEAPADAVGRLTFTPDALDRWRAWYGIDFGPLSAVVAGRTFGHALNPHEMRAWTALADPVAVMDVDLRRRGPVRTRRRVTITASAEGLLNAIALYFELEGPTGTFHSTRPAIVGADNHWRSPVHLLDAPIELRSGDAFELRYRYHPVLGQSSCEVVAAAPVA